MIDFFTDTSVLSLILPPITGVVTWFVARRKRQLDGIAHLQKTIDLLVAKNCELTKEIILLRDENAKLTRKISKLESKIDMLENNPNTK